MSVIDQWLFAEPYVAYYLVDMPWYNPPPAVEQSVDELMGRLNTWPKPGIHVKQFLELYAVCKCGMVTSRRYFDAHECIPCV